MSTNTNGRRDEDQENPRVWVLKSFQGFHILAWLKKSGKKVWRVSNLGVERSLPMLLVYSRNSEVITAHTMWLPRSHASVLCRSSRSYHNNPMGEYISFGIKSIWAMSKRFFFWKGFPFAKDYCIFRHDNLKSTIIIFS